jgi:hypothetical protein
LEGGTTAGSIPPATSGRIFISYRREETAYPAGWLYDRLAEHFGGGQVFKDVDSIQLGDDFVEVITNAVGSCDVLLALIGDQWLTITDAHGRRRLDNPDDFVRLEIEAALSRRVRVIPVLVDEAMMPGADELPDSLAALVRRQALELSPARFKFDTSRLLKVLDRTLAEVRATQQDAALRSPPAEPASDLSPTALPEPPEEREQAERSPVPGIPPPAAPATPGEPRPWRARRGVLLAIAAAVVAIAGGAIAALALLPGGSAGNSASSGNSRTGPNTYTASAPWRLKVEDDIQHNNNGCTITLTDAHSGKQVLRVDAGYGISTIQVHPAGAFRWRANNTQCLVATLAGSGMAKLPFPITQSGHGDSDAFAAGARIAVHVTSYHGGSDCGFNLYDPADGHPINFAVAHKGKANDTVRLDASGHRTAYLSLSDCSVRVSAAG